MVRKANAGTIDLKWGDFSFMGMIFEGEFEEKNVFAKPIDILTLESSGWMK
jgi:hypothetical protein